jgi:hypothetical protein
MVNSKKFEILQIAQNLSFLCRAEYKLFRFDILQYCRIRYYKQLEFFSESFETSKCQIFKISKTGSIELVHRIDFLQQLLCGASFQALFWVRVNDQGFCAKWELVNVCFLVKCMKQLKGWSRPLVCDPMAHLLIFIFSLKICFHGILSPLLQPLWL